MGIDKFPRKINGYDAIAVTVEYERGLRERRERLVSPGILQKIEMQKAVVARLRSERR
jgi:hypothetical protein